MKKFLLSFFVIAAFIAYSFHQQQEGIVTTKKATNNTSQNISTPTNGASSTPPNNQKTQASSLYRDGTYTGDVADAFYGNVQVQATIQSGKLADIQFLQYPSDRGTSVEISNQSMPLLKQEAIQAQNVHVDVVSGATQTSEAFQQSLQSALDKAKS